MQRFCPDRGSAEDAVGTAILVLHERIANEPLRFSAVPSVYQWLTLATRYAACRDARKRGKLHVGCLASVDEQPESANQEYLFQALLVHPEEALAVQDIAKVIHRLSPAEQEQVRELLADLSHDEPVSGARRSRLSRLRKRLRRLFEQAGFDVPVLRRSAQGARSTR